MSIFVFELHLNDNYIVINEIGTSILCFALTFICVCAISCETNVFFFCAIWGGLK